jgi:predicted phage terminase large subunit-like protein
VKCRRLIESPFYQGFWGDQFRLTGDQNTKTRFDNSKGGSRLSTSVGSALTGEGGAIIVVDDPNAAQEAFSEATIEATKEWWDSALSTRLNDPKTGAFVVIQQRLSEEDLTGHILSKDIGEWTHLCLPMRYEKDRSFQTVIGFEDWRQEEGELLWPDRFGEREVTLLEKQLGPWAAAGQLQQRPEPKGGGIIKREWFQLWDEPTYPPISYIVASIDTAFTEKTENDFSAMTVWGVFSGGKNTAVATKVATKDGLMTTKIERTYTDEHPKAILMAAWQERLQFHDLLEKIAATMKQYKVDKLLVENKASGPNIIQELRRIYNHLSFAVEPVDIVRTKERVGVDKVSRAHAVVPVFASGLVYAPDRSWADMVITQCSIFPRGKHDDLVDSTTMALGWLRRNGFLVRGEEWTADVEKSMEHIGAAPPPLYAV